MVLSFFSNKEVSSNFFLPFSFGWKFWDLINSFKLIKSGCVTVQRPFTIINKPFAHAGGVLFKNIEGLYNTVGFSLKNIGSLSISARVFSASISLPVRLLQEITEVGRIGYLSVLPLHILKTLSRCFAFLYWSKYYGTISVHVLFRFFSLTLSGLGSYDQTQPGRASRPSLPKIWFTWSRVMNSGMHIA